MRVVRNRFYDYLWSHCHCVTFILNFTLFNFLRFICFNARVPLARIMTTVDTDESVEFRDGEIG